MKTCTRGGLSAFGYTEYPSLIRGGHNSYQVRVEESGVNTLVKQINILVALNRETILLHKDELAPNAIVIFDADRINVDPHEIGRDDVRLLHVPSLRLSKELKVSELMENQLFLGASFALLKYDSTILFDVIKDTFSAKGGSVVDENIAAAKRGFDYTREQFDCDSFPHQLRPVPDKEQQMVITGNDALALGAIKAGCKFYAAYPMTPASSVLETLAGLQHEHGIVVKHVEDELSAINMTIGAGYAGVRAMCGTSGGGFALMTEGYSLASMNETPLVIIEAQRGGPATGLPTWTGQEDLKFVLSAGHGEFPRFVLAPGDPEECFTLVAEAFNIADEYQSPVIVLVDKHLSESTWSYPFFHQHIPIHRGPWVSDGELQHLAEQGRRFKRYALDTHSGVSRRVVPGQHKNGIFTANSDEHDEYGYSSEDSDNRVAMSQKRMRKEHAYKAVMPPPRMYGPEQADLTIVCWGSTKTMALEAMTWLNDEGRKVNMLHLTHISPFPAEAVQAILSSANIILDVEHNATAQMADVIRMHTGVVIEHRLLKNDGRPIYPEEIADKARMLTEVVAHD